MKPVETKKLKKIYFIVGFAPIIIYQSLLFSGIIIEENLGDRVLGWIAPIGIGVILCILIIVYVPEKKETKL